MNTIKEISDKLKKAESIVLYPHINMDGDTLGSCVALCVGLRTLGKKCTILIEDKIPENLMFLDKGYCVNTVEFIERNSNETIDFSVCIDCGNYDRFPVRKKIFLNARESMCIDHHGTTKPIFDYNYIDSCAAATGEIIYQILVEMQVVLSRELGEAIFTAITTDTGNFQYSNTTKQTHLITAELMDYGIDVNEVSKKIYESIRKEKIMLNSKILSQMYIDPKGKLAMAYATKALLKETNGMMEETEGVVDSLRSISGIEIAAFLKESEDDSIRVSLRSKGNCDVSKIASKFNGGGHAKAAGCTLNMNLDLAKETLRTLILDEIERCI